MIFSEPFPSTMIVLGKYNLAKAVTETRPVVPSAVIMNFSIAIIEAWKANPVKCPLHEII